MRITKTTLTAIAVAAMMTANAYAGDGPTSRSAAPDVAAGPSMLPLLRNWSVAQVLSPPGIAGTMDSAFAGARTLEKSTLVLSTFIPITPCRLVDTRGAFSPVYAGGPFSAGQTRVYRSQGNCGVPAGTNRVKAVSLAVTTPPTAASGDIEVISNAGTLGNTVVMVIQAGQWNSATTVSAVDTNGDFKVQLRSTPGDVVIDINGYYAGTSTAQQDYISIVGTYSGGGVLYSQNVDGTGSALNAYNGGTGSGAELASGTSALDVVQGGFRVRGAGVGSSSFVFQHKVDTSAAYPTGTGTLCGTSSGTNYVTVFDNPYTTGNPAAILFVTPTAGFGTSYGSQNPSDSYFVFYGPGCAGGTSNKWSIVSTSHGAVQNGLTFNVMVITP